MYKLTIEGLHKYYGSHEVLKGVSLKAKTGDVISLIGASGSGKSTFLRCINFLEQPDEGSMTLDGQPVRMVHDRHGLRVADADALIAALDAAVPDGVVRIAAAHPSTANIGALNDMIVVECV